LAVPPVFFELHLVISIDFFALPPFVLKKSGSSVRWPMRPILPATEKSEAFSQAWYQPDAVIGWRDQPSNGLWQ